MFCKKTEEFPRAKGVEFATRDIAEDEEALAKLERMGVMATPATVIGGDEVVVGFDRKKLEQLLGL